MPKITKAFEAVRPGHVYPSIIAEGEEVDGRLAEIAEQLGAIEPAKTAPANKAAKRAPENKG